MSITEGPTLTCECGTAFHLPENLAAHKRACQTPILRAEIAQLRQECMDLRAAVEIRERNIGEMTFQLRDANRLNGELRESLAEIVQALRLRDHEKMYTEEIEDAEKLLTEKPLQGPQTIEDLLGECRECNTLQADCGKHEKPRCEVRIPNWDIGRPTVACNLEKPCPRYAEKRKDEGGQK